MNRIERTGRLTIAITKTTKCTARFTTIQIGGNRTTLHTIILIIFRTGATNAITTNNRYFRLSRSNLFSQDNSDFAHHWLATDRA
jgi:hypothetical protein